MSGFQHIISKCQIFLALVLFVSFAGIAFASPIPPAPVCKVKAVILELVEKQAKIKVTEETKIKDGYQKDWECNFKKENFVTITLTDNELTLFKKGSLISVDLEQAGDENGSWVNSSNLKSR